MEAHLSTCIVIIKITIEKGECSFHVKNLEERITKNNIPMNPSERMGRQGSPFFFVECCPARFAVLRTLEMHIGFSVATSLNSPLM